MAIRPKTQDDNISTQIRTPDRRQADVRQYIALVLGAALVALCLTFIWPTPWVIDKERNGGLERIVRVNRFTGVKEVSTPGGWK